MTLREVTVDGRFSCFSCFSSAKGGETGGEKNEGRTWSNIFKKDQHVTRMFFFVSKHMLFLVSQKKLEKTHTVSLSQKRMCLQTMDRKTHTEEIATKGRVIDHPKW